MARPVTAGSASGAATVAAPGSVTPSRSRANGWGALHGRLGLRYFVTASDAGGAAATTQPAIDARLDGQRLGGSPLGLTVDVRAHRTRYAGGAGARATGSTRVYQAALHLDGASGPARLTFGRQFSTALPAIGLFDGVAADLGWTHAAVGAFAGSQPDAVTFGYSGAVREYGAYGQLRGAPGSGGVWSLTSGAVGSYQAGEVNREFLYLQGLFVSRHLSLYASQEVDFNRGWKADIESGRATPTSTFASARLSLGDAVSVNGGYDNRRSIRLYRDFLSPEVEFDDAFRQGVWGGAQLSVGNHVHAAVDTRRSSGGTGGRAESGTASLSVTRLSPLGIGVRARSTQYTGDELQGRLSSGAVEIQPLGSLRLEANAGRQEDVRAAAGTAATRLTWVGFDLDLGIARSLFLTLSTYRESSPEGRVMQTFGALSYRF
jgi:hypothetical protein